MERKEQGIPQRRNLPPSANSKEASFEGTGTAWGWWSVRSGQSQTNKKPHPHHLWPAAPGHHHQQQKDEWQLLPRLLCFDILPHKRIISRMLHALTKCAYRFVHGCWSQLPELSGLKQHMLLCRGQKSEARCSGLKSACPEGWFLLQALGEIHFSSTQVAVLSYELFFTSLQPLVQSPSLFLSFLTYLSLLEKEPYRLYWAHLGNLNGSLYLKILH